MAQQAATLEGFYRLISGSRTEGGAQLQVIIDPAHPVYDGHFPGHPVAPGAALTQMAIDEAQRLIGGEREFTGARQVKFLAVLNPNETGHLTLGFTFAEREDGLHFQCNGSAGATVYFKLHGTFR